MSTWAQPAGFVVRMEDRRAFYFAGDTALFGDMRLIAEMYAPEIAFLPIGDHYTMGPDAAAHACKLLLVRQVVPMHYGTFPILTGTPDRLKELVEPGRRRAGAEAGGDGAIVCRFRFVSGSRFKQDRSSPSGYARRLL